MAEGKPREGLLHAGEFAVRSPRGSDEGMKDEALEDPPPIGASTPVASLFFMLTHD